MPLGKGAGNARPLAPCRIPAKPKWMVRTHRPLAIVRSRATKSGCENNDIARVTRLTNGAGHA
jgi:hypothetical protein